MLTTRDVVGLDVKGSARSVRFADGTAIDAHAVILATGVSYRTLDAPGVDELTGAGVYYGVRADRGARPAPTRTFTSSAGRTRPARPRSTSPGTPGR